MLTLILAAHASELAFIESGQSVGLHFETMGVGLIEAAIGTTEMLLKHRPDEAWLVGTCGVFGDHNADQFRLDLKLPALEIESFAWIDASILNGHAEDVGQSPSIVQSTARYPSHHKDNMPAALHPRVRCACTAGMTIHDDWATTIAARTGCQVENLEGFAFARACERLGVPWRATLVVTNIVGADGRRQYAERRTQAAQRIAEVIQDWAQL